MNKIDKTSFPSVSRDDLLISVCFSDLGTDSSSFDAIKSIAFDLEANFRFFEIIVVAEKYSQLGFYPLINSVKNIRLLSVRNGTPFYRKRVIAAEEAIGDVVLLTTASELSAVDPIKLIEKAANDQSAVLALRTSKITNCILGSFLMYVGRIAGFMVNMNILQTLAIPRTILNQILVHPEVELALRFLPRDIRIPTVFINSSNKICLPRDAGLNRRLLLLESLLVCMAPRILQTVTIASALLSTVGFVFALYVIGVWFLKDNVAQGWLSLSATLSITGFFLGISVMGLSLGLQQLLSRTNRDIFEDLSAEVNRIDIFGHLKSELNVETDNIHKDEKKLSAQ